MRSILGVCEQLQNERNAEKTSQAGSCSTQRQHFCILIYKCINLQQKAQIYTYKKFKKMPSWLIVVGISILAVGFFVLGLSLTLMIKGHHIDSEISTNKDMQRLGIKCAVQETREMDGSASCSEEASPLQDCSGNCGACDIEEARK